MMVLYARGHELAFDGAGRVSCTCRGDAAEARRGVVTWHSAGIETAVLGGEASAASKPTIGLIASRTKAIACFMRSPLIQDLSFHTCWGQVDTPSKAPQALYDAYAANAEGPNRAAPRSGAVRLRPGLGAE